MNHTPTPWQLAGITTERLQGSQRSIEADFIHLEADGYTAGGGIGLIHNKPNGIGMDNARFILTACNAHEELLEALKGYNLIDYTLLISDALILNTDPRVAEILEKLSAAIQQVRPIATQAIAKAEGREG